MIFLYTECKKTSKEIQVKFLRISVQNIVSYGISCGFICENTFPGDFPAGISAELPADC
jgi:hypothetical protein